ncbi:DUF6266 family protein [Odoribacter lunatus]|uniref:DUF6266 family protein n=1 Tax=Odoribacter lunatus TaxID=2941335 RepID=UPI0020407500|nr:DUF6266 family protein [Odoribacter lunatus]
MGKIYPDLAGAFARSVGNVVYYLKAGENLVRSKSKKPYKSNTPAQQEQKGKFGDLNRLGSIVVDVVNVGFPQRPLKLSAVNMFFKVNKDCFKHTEGEQAVIDYERLVYSNGSLFPPQVKATLDATDRVIELSGTAMPELSRCRPDDIVYGVLMDTTNGFCQLVEICKREDGGTMSVKFPEFWDTDSTVVHAFAVSCDGKKASKSVHVAVS